MEIDKAKLHGEIVSAQGRVDKRKVQTILTRWNLLETVQSHGPAGSSPLEAYYWFYYSLTDYPNSCKVCGSALTKFANFRDGYSLFSSCSMRCAALAKDRQGKITDTLQARYGVTHPMHIDEVKNKVKETNLARYGVENMLSSDLARKGLEKKFGVEFISQSVDWKQKTTKTFDERYGGRGFSGDMAVAARQTLAEELGIAPGDFSYQQLAAWVSSKRRLLEQCVDSGFVLCSSDYPNDALVLQHECGELKTIGLAGKNRLRCLKCNPLSFSRFEIEVADFVSSLGVTLDRNTRSIIPPLELDIFIPTAKLAIECNGDYWHSYSSTETKHQRNKHLHKLERCEAAGIRLMQIAEHEWKTRGDIIRSMIAVKLGFAKILYARRLIIKTITMTEANAFCMSNHVQGPAGASLALGAFHDGTLVSCVTVAKNRFKKNGSWELVRFACLRDTVIVGVFSKLLKSLSSHISGTLESYLDRRLFDGHSLIKTGWTLDRTSAPGYCWLWDGVRVSRNKTQKHRLEKLLGKRFDSSISEAANMFRAGATRLWDCGQHCYTLTL